MFTSHSACPTTDNPPCVPDPYRVLHPAPLDPVGPVCGLRCRLSEAAAKVRGSRTPAPATALETYHQNETR